MIKIFDFFFNRYYFNTLHLYKSYQISNSIIQLEKFQEDKIICLFNNNIKIYDILKLTLLYKIDIKYSNENIRKIKLFRDNKFILFTSDESDDIDGDLQLFEFIENKEKNEYSCNEITRIKEKSNNILIKRNNIICIKKGFVNIYSFINNKYLQLQTKIIIPKLINNYSFHKGVLVNSNCLNIIEYHYNIIEIWSLKHCKFINEKQIKLENYILGYILLVKMLKNKDSILFAVSNCIYLYSNINKEIIKKIKLKNENWDILGISLTKNRKIYLNDRNKIYILDIPNETSYELTRSKYKFETSLIILEKNNNNIIINISENKILFFNISIYQTIIEDVDYFLMTWVYFILELLLFKIEIIKYKKISFIFALISIWILKKIKKYSFFKKIKNNIISSKIPIIPYILIHSINSILFFFIYNIIVNNKNCFFM